ncbi:MAG: hypothetical protein EZS28_002881 [Streblomastix strix]|uniref:Uncharacterized protein n=1 Tax=Streblomastix strix TaxID=222440 RepID=A0A5J4X2N4_9EUKA|nr:MAG: hypothetical protein EZS28_002881 [Streblomastix strix]
MGDLTSSLVGGVAGTLTRGVIGSVSSKAGGIGKGNLQLSSESISPWPLVNQLKFFVQPPADCTSYSVPKFGCKCTSNYNPYSCICPTTPEELLNIPKIKYPCIANDQRGSCKTCTGATSDASDCICPTTPSGLQNVPIDRCYCISGDLRSDCQPEKCTSSIKPPQGCICSRYNTPSGCTCPILGTDMDQGISTSICPCIKNDVRYECQPTSYTSSTVPQQGCICSQTASSSGCKCPQTAEELVGIESSYYCDCILGDRRYDCQPTECQSFINIPAQGCILYNDSGVLRQECKDVDRATSADILIQLWKNGQFWDTFTELCSGLHTRGHPLHKFRVEYQFLFQD